MVVVRALPRWELVADWRGKLVAVCDYAAGTEPGPRVWDEGYPVWWKLENVRLLKEAIPMHGNVGMWPMRVQLCELAKANPQSQLASRSEF